MTPDELFPLLEITGYRITSSADTQYNCVAWALGFTQKWWWPESDQDEVFWPDSIPNRVSVEAFIALFAKMGFVPGSDESVSPHIDKIALFVDTDGMPSHVARQLPNGKWTSKLGNLEDIEHKLHALEGSDYGIVSQIYQRPKSTRPP